MAKRLFDLVAAGIALIAFALLFCIVAIGIRLASPGPVFYRALRVGRGQVPFTMYKFRTMHARQRASSSLISAKHDPRVFALGLWLRRLKIDELPQLFNVLRGEMSIVGPRPEDPHFVRTAYSRQHLETLQVLPGLASPGSIYNYTHGEQMLDGDDPDKQYIEQLLPIKLALDLVYVREASFLYDVEIISRTIRVVVLIALGKREFPDPPEMRKARELLSSFHPV